jgi:murein DD-endopeptidase MepM/ murein hydrolase activator NlpD
VEEVTQGLAQPRGRRRPSPTARLARILAGGVLGAASTGCQVVHEVGKDTVQVVDTVARVDTVVRTDTVRIDDGLTGIGDELVATALAALDTASPLPAPAPAAGGTRAPAAVASPAGAPPADTARRATAARGDTAAPVVTAADMTTLHAHRLLVPVAGVRAAGLPNTFNEKRGSRNHGALDILAPRGTPVLSTDSGRVFKLYTSDAGGLTLYAADPSGRYMYYYAHLDRYHPRMREGLALARGDTIGFVGVTGNAAPEVPHLHFAIARIADPREWWKGTPVNPQTLLVDP